MLNNYPNGSYRSSRSKPCPVCGRTKDGDCAVDVLADGQVKVRCHTHLGDAGVAGFVYRGLTDCATWGLYFSDDRCGDRVGKQVRPAGRVEFLYPNVKGDPLVKVVRVDDGGGNKKFSQWHRQYGKGMVWSAGCPASFQKQLHLYRIGDELNRSAIRNGDPLLVVEGEGKVDLLMSLGIAATCSIGGAGKWRRYGYPNYLQDLAGAELVLVPDRWWFGHRSDPAELGWER